MKSILIAGVLAAVAVTALASLRCRQCTSSSSGCDVIEDECEAGSVSCVESSVNSTLGQLFPPYENKFCSANNCSENNSTVDFTVHVSDSQSFRFASQCCGEGACGDFNPVSRPQELSSINCTACYGNNETTCQENNTTQQCHSGEQCVHVIVDYGNDTNRETVVVRGCSNISNSTCQLLSSENTTIEDLIFQKVECPAVLGDETDPSESPTTTASTTTTTPSASPGLQAFHTTSIFGSLLLLKLLF